MKKARRSADNEQVELLRAILISELALAGIPQREIRAIARCDMNTVTQIIRHLGPKAGRSVGREEARHGERNQ